MSKLQNDILTSIKSNKDKPNQFKENSIAKPSIRELNGRSDSYFLYGWQSLLHYCHIWHCVHFVHTFSV